MSRWKQFQQFLEQQAKAQGDTGILTEADRARMTSKKKFNQAEWEAGLPEAETFDPSTWTAEDQKEFENEVKSYLGPEKSKRPGDELVIPDKPKGPEHVLRCDDSWERQPNGTIKLVRKNCRWEVL